MKWLDKEEGAISIFLVIIFMALLFLAGIIVDAARIMVAENKAEIALESAARSVLADYDPQMAGDFGLFAVEAKAMEEDFQRYFLSNLKERHQGISFIHYQIQSIQIRSASENTLLNNKAFENQVLQYMKYKAPLKMGETLIEAFKSGNFQQKAQLLEGGLEAMTVRERAQDKTSALNKALGQVGKDYKKGAKDSLALLKKISSQEFEEVWSDYSQYKELLLLADASLETTYSESAARGSAQDTKARAEIDEVEYIDFELDRLKQDLAANARLLEQIIPLEEELESMEKHNGADSNQKEKELQARIDQLARGWRPLQGIELENFDLPKISGGSIAKRTSLKGMLENLIGRSVAEDNPVTQLIPPEDFIQANQAKAPREADAYDAWEDEDLFNDFDPEKARYLLLGVSDLTRRITKAIEALAEDGRDKLYIAAYVLDKYTFVTSQTKRSHYFDKGEIEYILCGNSQEITNIIKVFSRVFFLRFTINTLDALIRSKMPHYLLRLADALVRGFEKACEDMKSLYQGIGVPLCAEVSYPLKYSDYLALLLFMQDKETQLDRMRQLIQIDIRKSNSEFTLSNTCTLFDVEARIAVNLWFIPALHLDRLGFSQFQEGRYSFARYLSPGY